MFGAVKLTKNADLDKYSYLRYGIDIHFFQFQIWANNVVLFGVHNSSSVHIDNKKDILVLAKGPTQGLDHTTITAEA